MTKKSEHNNAELNDSSSKYSTLKSAMWASSGAFIATGVFSFFINVLMLTGPLFMLQIYDRVLSSRSLPTLGVLFALVAGLFAFLGLLELVRSRVLSRIGTSIYKRIHNRVFDAVMHLSLRTGGSEGSTRPLQELTVFQQYISGPGPVSMFDSPWVPVYILVIFMFHWILGVLAVVAAVLLFIIALLNDIRARKPTMEAGKAAARGNQFADAGRRNAEVLVAMGMLGAIRGRWEDSQLDALEYQDRASDRAGTLTSVSKSLRLFLQSAMLAAGALLTIQQEITAGTMIAASIILGRALQPVEQAIAHWRSFVRARQAYHSLNELLNNIATDEDKVLLRRPKGRIDVRGLAVAAPNSRKIILRNINFSIEPGKILGIIGQSGGGKSTLARVLVGAWPAVGGEVRIDGATHNQWKSEELGKYIGYLPQDVELFGGRVSENIARFQPDFDEKDVFKATELAGVDEMIKHLGDEGYNTDIGHMGGNLSAGQRQRIALARAMYKAPSIVVLDEPNSNLDSTGDEALLVALMAMRDNGQTVIIISHRMNVLKITDYLLKLEGGQQEDFGPRDEVIKRIMERNKQASAAEGSPLQGMPHQGAARQSTNHSTSPFKMTVGTPFASVVPTQGKERKE